MQWANDVLEVFNFSTSLSGQVATDEPIIFVSNHISYMDIPLMMANLKDCSFVSKAEIALWPIFGSAAKKCSTIFVERHSKTSRTAARDEIRRHLQNHQKRVVVFPSGTTSIHQEAHWKIGVFQIAHELGVRVQPIRINYSRLREVAYIDSDFFPTHLWRLSKGLSCQAYLDFHPPLEVRDPLQAVEYCRKWCNAHLPAVNSLCGTPSHPVLTKA